MQRRKFIQYAAASLAASYGSSLGQGQAIAQSGGVSIQALGHMCFLFSGSGRRILVDPFRPIGCTKGYRSPNVAADLVLISSRLFDEGVVEGLPGKPRLLDQAGAYQFTGMQVQGITTDHDDLKGKQFGKNVAWRWNQGGVNILHLGGVAAPITVEQKILMGRPDVLLLPVGGGAKAFTPEEAKAAIQDLNPKLVIPTQYRTQAADTNACDIVPIDNFLSLMQGTAVNRAGSSLSVSASSLPSATTIEVLTYA